ALGQPAPPSLRRSRASMVLSAERGVRMRNRLDEEAVGDGDNVRACANLPARGPIGEERLFPQLGTNANARLVDTGTRLEPDGGRLATASTWVGSYSRKYGERSMFSARSGGSSWPVSTLLKAR